MKKTFTTIFYAFTLIGLMTAQDGQLDPTWNSNGILQMDVSGGHDTPHGIIIQPDNKVVVAFSGGFPNASNFDFGVVRFLEDGLVDSTFGVDGIYHYSNSNASDLLYDIKIMADGGLLLTGSYGVEPANTDFFLVKLDGNGVPDPSFGMDGLVILPIDTGLDYARSSVELDDGKIVVCGYSHVPGFNFRRNVVVRFNADGSLDDTFGTAGMFIWNDNGTANEMYNIGILADGGILAGGFSNPAGSERHALYKILADGSGLDASFGNMGEVLAPFEGKGYGMLIHTNGNIYLTGGASGPLGNDLLILAYDQNGMPVVDFGIDGAQKVDSDVSDIGFGITQQLDGKILVCGESGGGFGGAPRAFYTVRFTEDGMLDVTWADNGIAREEVSTFFAWADKVTVMPDGRVMVAGPCAHTNNDMVVVRYGNAPVSFIPTVASINFKSFPNPVTDRLFIQSNEQLESYQITNLNGQLMSRGNFLFEQSQYEILVNDFPNGNYVLTVIGEHGLGSRIFQKM